MRKGGHQRGGTTFLWALVWRRFGTPTGVAGSGTEEEFLIAYGFWKRDPSLVIMFYFCQKPFVPRVDKLDRIREVLSFRQELQGKTLAWDYESEETFEREIRKYLHLRLRRLVEERKNKGQSLAVLDDETFDSLGNWRTAARGMRAFYPPTTEFRRYREEGKRRVGRRFEATEIAASLRSL